MIPHPKRPWLHFLRACCLLADSLTFLFGLTQVPIAESTVLVFLAPAFVTILSPLLFGIEANRYQWLSVIIGFCGVLIIINPASESFSLWMLFPLATAFFFALWGILQIIFAVVYGVVLFASSPGIPSMLGMGLIFISGLLVYAKRPLALRSA